MQRDFALSATCPGVPRVDAFGREALTLPARRHGVDRRGASRGVLCFASAFPGGGPVTEVLTGVPTVRASDDALYASDLVPFRAAFDAGVAGVLIAEASYTALDCIRNPSIALCPILGPPLEHNSGSMASPSRMRRRWRRAGAIAFGQPTGRRGHRSRASPGQRGRRALRALIDAMERGTLDGAAVLRGCTPTPRPRGVWRACRGRSLEVAANDDHAWLDEVGERTISVLRGRSVRIADPVEVAVVGARADQVVLVAAGFASGIGEAGGDTSGVRRVLAPSAVVRTPLVVVVVPPAGVSTCEQDVGALCTEARRLGRVSPLSSGVRTRR